MHTCPNCGIEFEGKHEHTGCLLAALIECVRERGEKTEAELLQLLIGCDVDSLWDTLGLVVDDFQNGEFNL